MYIDGAARMGDEWLTPARVTNAPARELRIDVVVGDLPTRRLEDCSCDVLREELRTWLPRRQISLVDLHAVPAAITTWSPLVTERNILPFVNSSASAARAKGYSPKVGSALTLQEFATACARWRCGVGLDIIGSSANIAKGPGRNDLSLIKKIGSTEYDKAVIYRNRPSERRGRQHRRWCGPASLPAVPAEPRPPAPGESAVVWGENRTA